MNTVYDSSSASEATALWRYRSFIIIIIIITLFMIPTWWDKLNGASLHFWL